MISIVIFNKKFWRKGIATAAIEIVVHEVFCKFNVDSIGAISYAHNISSIAMLKKAKFKLVEEFVDDGVKSMYFELHKTS